MSLWKRFKKKKFLDNDVLVKFKNQETYIQTQYYKNQTNNNIAPCWIAASSNVSEMNLSIMFMFDFIIIRYLGSSCNKLWKLNICNVIKQNGSENGKKKYFLIFGIWYYSSFDLVKIPWRLGNRRFTHIPSCIGYGANIRVLLIPNSSSHSSLDVNSLEFPCLAATMCFTRLRNPW